MAGLPPDRSRPFSRLSAPSVLTAELIVSAFGSFVTPRVIQLLFLLQMVGLVIVLLGMVGTAFAQGTGVGLLVLLLSPLLFLIGVLLARIYLELVIVLFRIYETLRDRPA